MRKYFSENLTLLRKGWGLSQTEMASKFGVSQSAYGRWEDASEPNLDTLLALSDFFKVPFGDFITKKLEEKDIPPRWGTQPTPSIADDSQKLTPEELTSLRGQVQKLELEVEGLKGIFSGLDPQDIKLLEVLQTIVELLEAGLDEKNYLNDKKQHLDKLAAILSKGNAS